MHLHLPKPLHGWREFTGEVGIIVIGVLIALGAEQLLEDWRWHSQVAQAQGAFKDELRDASYVAYERLSVQPCLQLRLRMLAAHLNSGGRKWVGTQEQFNGAKTYYSNVIPVVYRPPFRVGVSDAWRNALADGTINHLDSRRARSLSAAYGGFASFLQEEQDESRTAALLAPLSSNRELDDRTRLELVQVIAQLDRLDNDLVTISKDLLDAIAEARLGFAPADVTRVRNEVVHVQRNYRGACVRTDVPLYLGGV